MKRMILAAFVFAAVLSSCGEETTSSPQVEEAEVKISSNTDPHPELVANDDSLRYVYSRPLFNGIYLANRKGHSLITLLPVEPYEKTLTKYPNCTAGTGVNYVIADVRRFVHFNDSTSLEKTVDGFALLLTAEQKSQLQSFANRFKSDEYVIHIGEHAIKTGKVEELLSEENISFDTCPDTEQSSLKVSLLNYKNLKKDPEEALGQ
ncbi:MAG: hypothetical protein O2984_04170 [Bacteroidetes bacterium]|nr:hypothetical protein [Bacteroidota bacterium]